LLDPIVIVCIDRSRYKKLKAEGKARAGTLKVAANSVRRANIHRPHSKHGTEAPPVRSQVCLPWFWASMVGYRRCGPTLRGWVARFSPRCLATRGKWCAQPSLLLVLLISHACRHYRQPLCVYGALCTARLVYACYNTAVEVQTCEVSTDVLAIYPSSPHCNVLRAA